MSGKMSAVIVLFATMSGWAVEGGSAQVPSTPPGSVRVTGIVTDSLSGSPISFAVASVDTLNVTALSDRSGRFVMQLPQGVWNLKIRKIGYRMNVQRVEVYENADVILSLQRIPVTLDAISVTATAEDPGMWVIRQAIARKRDALAGVNDYRYEAYVKLLVTDLSRSPDSTDHLFMISETQTRAYWEQPDRYQEVILGRRQSRNLAADENLVSVGQMVNFNRDRIDLQKYSVASPTALDALEFYDYRMLDTLEVEGRRVFRLAIQPKSEAIPLFVGMIDVADSTFDVMAVDVGANDAVRFDFFRNLRYRQRLEDVGEDLWMPVDISFSGEIHVSLPIPGFPEHVGFEHRALLSSYRFDEGEPPKNIGEYMIVVDDDADDIDSTEWANSRPVPLEEVEALAYRRIDSLEQVPPSVGEVLVGGIGAAVAASNNSDFFHFNRAEGFYLGAGGAFRRLSPNVVLRAKTGYALGAKLWQHQYGVQYRISPENRLWASGWYRDEVVTRRTVMSRGTNGTHEALILNADPFDYYRVKGVVLSLGGRIMDFTRLTVQYNDVRHYSLPIVSDYSFFRRDIGVRENPPAVDGRLRSFNVTLGFDSRRLLRRAGQDFYLNEFTYTQLSLSAEVSHPQLVPSDFSYSRFVFGLHRRQRTFNWGLTYIDAAAGFSTGMLPPQRYFTVDFGKAFLWQARGFNTLRESNFAGDAQAMLFIRHDFEGQLFSRTGIVGIRDLPFTISAHAGAFVSRLRNSLSNPGDLSVRQARSPYVEIGFGVSNLTPMFSPLNLAVSFSWQLSAYDTNHFAWAVGIPAF
ncbi:MAG: DUF5686 and carboxypeptidase regulatory-like domain-containing protein [Gemmatimonadota bacterium]|nr:DUF5686 and carboxypeptidase regulatory-like domain-containing protein [Gemmatimonadota bacterium]MDH5804308.1 DUF5686 and carboxypeptidase regulatory-like domain-containing protein [Gemmatimonadota bacterium]